MYIKKEECSWLTSTLHEQFRDWYFLYEQFRDFSWTSDEQAQGSKVLQFSRAYERAEQMFITSLVCTYGWPQVILSFQQGLMTSSWRNLIWVGINSTFTTIWSSAKRILFSQIKNSIDSHFHQEAKHARVRNGFEVATDFIIANSLRYLL